MSTYYYVVCNKHKERVQAVSRNAGGFAHLGDSEITLQPFLVSHTECSLKVISENDDDAYDELFLDWRTSNFNEIMRKKREF